MKKIICLTAASALIAALAIGVGAADEKQIVLTASDAAPTVGETFTVTITAENFEAFNTAMFYDVEYDEEYLEWTGGSWLLEDGTLSDYVMESLGGDNGEQGRSGVFYTENAVEGTQDIATMEFTVLKESAEAQTVGCSVILKENETELSSGIDVLPLEVEVGAEEAVVEGTISFASATLELESEVFLNIYTTVTGFEGLDLTERMGLMIWTGDESAYSEADFVYGNENVSVYPGAVRKDDKYSVQSPGIAAKELGDERYMRVYVNNGTNSYAYSRVTYYGPEKYALDRLKNGRDENLKYLVAAMLDYAAAAQIYFDYRTDDLANAAMIASYSKYRSEYAADMLQAVVSADSNLIGTWKRDKTNCPTVTPTLVLESIITNNFRVKYTTSIMNENQTATFMFWNKAAYEEMVANNISFADMDPTMTVESGIENGVYLGGYNRVAAKELGDTFYMCVEVTTANGSTYRSGVISYSAHAYITDRLNNSSDTNLLNLVKGLTVYGDSAKTYFANRT